MSRNGQTLRDSLKDFVVSHPDGWGHGDWEELLHDLKRKDLDTADEVAIGAALEREHLLAMLDRAAVKGLGPKRRNALADRFGRLWDLQQASAEDVAREAGLPQPLAEALLSVIRP